MEVTAITNLRRAVLRSIAEYTWNDCLPEHISDIPTTLVTEEGPRIRCCVHKERAVLRNRIQMALGQPIGTDIVEASKTAISTPFSEELPIMDVLPDACDQCPIDKYYVTDLCRHCISHKCMNNCPKQAITIHQNRAFINRQLCIECGRCRQSCPYGAIIEISRPCARACALGAISYNDNKRVTIDYSKCVSCGNCRIACPFGALDERSMLVQTLTALKQQENVVAMVAPSIIGQFGMKIQPAQIISAIKRLGFTEVVEVAVGADLTAIHETEELLDKVPAKLKFMTSSCCPAFVELVKKHFPDNRENISETVSPMVATARLVKETMGEVKTCFIGPCIAKKSEGRLNRDCVDFVLTYEELQCMFEGVGIDLSAPVTETFKSKAASDGLGFPLNKGVQAAVVGILDKRDIKIAADYAAGLELCKDQLTEVVKGKKEVQYFEGMACSKGCVDGPGALAQEGLTRVLLTRFAKEAAAKSSDEDSAAAEAFKRLNLEVKHS